MIYVKFNTCKLFPPIKAYRKFLKIVITIGARSKKVFPKHWEVKDLISIFKITKKSAVDGGKHKVYQY